MAAHRKRIEELLDAAAARGAAVVVEQMRGEFRVLGETMESLREQLTRGFTEMNRRFDLVDRRFDGVEQQLADVKHQLAQMKDAVVGQ